MKNQSKLGVNSACPCGSNIKYKKCCQLFHKGKIPQNALELMKSRYSAYVYCNVKYLVDTTHKENKDFQSNQNDLSNDIMNFCKQAQFEGLTIFEFIDGSEKSYVTFKANIKILNEDNSFTEKSTFLKENGLWKYYSAEFI